MIRWQQQLIIGWMGTVAQDRTNSNQYRLWVDSHAGTR